MEKSTALLNRLNGWQRLFSVYLLFLHIPFSIFAIAEIDTEPADTDAVLAHIKAKQVAPESIARIQVHNYSYITRPITFNGKSARDLINSALSLNISEEIAVSSPFGEHNYALVVPKDMPQDKMTLVAKTTYEYVKDAYWKSYISELFSTLGISILIATILYCFGYALGWIIKGFLKN